MSQKFGRLEKNLKPPEGEKDFDVGNANQSALLTAKACLPTRSRK